MFLCMNWLTHFKSEVPDEGPCLYPYLEQNRFPNVHYTMNNKAHKVHQKLSPKRLHNIYCLKNVLIEIFKKSWDSISLFLP